MTPRETQVFLCTTVKEYKRCRRFCKQHGQDRHLEYPTVFAVRHGRIVGVAGTYDNEGLVCMGPLVVSDQLKSKGFVGLRLVQVLEDIYKKAGLTHYFITVHNQLKRWQQAAERYGCRAVGVVEDHTWYVRERL